jgi:DNA-binding NtrC family response regulator
MVSERDAIIIVDDEQDLADLFTEALKIGGLNAIGFYNPTLALKHIENYHNAICLVVTDWRMPELDGLELTKRIAEIDSEIGVMLMSAYELEQNQLREVIKNDYLRKPIRMDKLIETIKNEYFAKDCKDTCEPKTRFNKKTIDLMR